MSLQERIKRLEAAKEPEKLRGLAEIYVRLAGGDVEQIIGENTIVTLLKKIAILLPD